MPNVWNLSRSKVLVEIREMLLEILKALTLGHIVGVFVKISDPMIV
jgi:hypothetical protein